MFLFNTAVSEKLTNALSSSIEITVSAMLDKIADE